ncbi:MAG: O-antigen ligase family protein [Armatimonadota bacterium]|nr:O-antigen ligase family protein [bacterium]MDW8319835.1 O-antigen ligase family protein [Armatimonadota bacterium]
MKKRLLTKKPTDSLQPLRPRTALSTWLLGVAVVLAPLTTGRLELGGEPVEPSLRGVVAALFTTGTLLPLAIWLVALLACVALIWEWRQRSVGDNHIPHVARVLATLLLLWMLASVVVSMYRWGTVVAWSWWVVAVVSAWLFSLRRGQDGWTVGFALAIAGTVAAAFAMREYAENARIVPNWRVFGTFFNPNFLAGYLCLTMPVTLAMAMAGAARSHNSSPSGGGELRWLLGFGAWMQMTAILLTGSRFGTASALLALMVTAGWMAFNRSWNRQRALLFGVVCLMVLATAFFAARSLTARVTAAQTVQEGEYSGGFRLWTWRGTLRMVQAHPLLGTGLGTYEIAYPRYAYVGFTRLAHNSYLQLGAEAGVPALALLLGTLGVLAWRVTRAEAHARNDAGSAGFSPLYDARVLRAGLAGAIAAGIARNLIDSDWSIFACLFTFWAVVGLMLSFAPFPKAGEQGGQRHRVYLAHVVLLAVALAVLTLRMGGALSANGANWNLSQGIPDEEGYQRALHWEPFNGDHYLSVGMLYLGMARAGDLPRAEEARKTLLRSAELTPYSKTWYHLGNLYRDVLGEPAQAAGAYRRALQLDPHALRVMAELGKTLEQQGKLQEAEAVYQRMLEIEKSVYNRVRAVPELPEVDYAFAYAGLARIARLQGKPADEVRDLYSRALQILDADRAARENTVMLWSLKRPAERQRALDDLRQECERALR